MILKGSCIGSCILIFSMGMDISIIDDERIFVGKMFFGKINIVENRFGVVFNLWLVLL